MVTYCKHCIILRNISCHNAKSVVDKPYHVISVCLAVCKHMASIYVTFPPYEHRLPISTRPSAVFAVSLICQSGHTQINRPQTWWFILYGCYTLSKFPWGFASGSWIAFVTIYSSITKKWFIILISTADLQNPMHHDLSSLSPFYCTNLLFQHFTVMNMMPI